MYRYRIMVTMLGSGRLLYQHIFSCKSDNDAVLRASNAVWRTAVRKRLPMRYLGWRLDKKVGIDQKWTLVSSFPATPVAVQTPEMDRV